MARKSTKTAANTVQSIAEALDTALNLEWNITAENLNITIPELQERMASKLDDTVFTWSNIPVEHQPVVDAIVRDLESEASVRRFDAPSEPVADLPPIQEPEELPIVEDEVPQPKRGKGGKLTQKKTETITEQTTAAEKLNTGIQQAEQMLTARKGAKTGAKLATIELLAQETAYNSVKSEGLKRKVAQLVGEIAEDENFDPADLLAEMGLDSNSEILETLTQTMTDALGKYDVATQEVMDTSWANGWNLDAEMAKLTDLLN